MKWLAIVAQCILAAVLFGIAHDQVTARICIEYFTIGHMPIGTDSPTLVGLFWGIVATWWVGAGLGVPLACVARCGSRPRIEPRELLRPLGLLLLATAAAAILFGLLGRFAASAGWLRLDADLYDRVPKARHVAFLTDLCAHLASYAAGAIGGIILMVRVARQRKTRSAARAPDISRAGRGSPSRPRHAPAERHGSNLINPECAGIALASRRSRGILTLP